MEIVSGFNFFYTNSRKMRMNILKLEYVIEVLNLAYVKYNINRLISLRLVRARPKVDYRRIAREKIINPFLTAFCARMIKISRSKCLKSVLVNGDAIYFLGGAYRHKTVLYVFDHHFDRPISWWAVASATGIPNGNFVPRV
jgi:hypothetical protein